MPEPTAESTLLNHHPGLREKVAMMADFIAWRQELPVVEVDGETFYVVGGDQLKDHDQIIVAWTNQFRPTLLSKRENHE